MGSEMCIRDRFASAGAAQISSTTATNFTGYDLLEDSAVVAEIFLDGKALDKIDSASVTAEQSLVIVLDKTPFYGESGGQVGDRGLLTGDSVRFEVADTRKSGSAFLHFGVLAQGSLAIGDKLSASVDACLLYTSPSPRDATLSRMPSSA